MNVRVKMTVRKYVQTPSAASDVLAKLVLSWTRQTENYVYVSDNTSYFEEYNFGMRMLCEKGGLVLL